MLKGGLQCKLEVELRINLGLILFTLSVLAIYSLTDFKFMKRKQDKIEKLSMMKDQCSKVNELSTVRFWKLEEQWNCLIPSSRSNETKADTY